MENTVIDLEEYKILKNQNYTYRDLVPKIQSDVLIGYDSAFDVEAIKNSIKNIFLVNKGEVPGKPQFGNPLNLTVFDNFDFFTENTIKQAIKVEIEKYEPRAEIIEININVMQEYNRIIVEVIFKTNIIENDIIESIYLPFSQNDFTYLGGRTPSTL